MNNILGQEHIKSILTTLVANKKLPSTMLFSGPGGVGKVFTAFELAKAIICGSLSYGNCKDAARIHYLSHPDVVFITANSIMHSLNFHLFVAKNTKSIAKEHFLMLVKRLILQIELGIAQINKSINRKRITDTYIASLINDVRAMAKDIQADKYNIELLSEMMKKLQELDSMVNVDTISINSIRNIIEKITLKPFIADRKVFIIEGVEKLNVYSANSFLKLLEEPPKNTYIILIANRVDNIIPTILSRCFHLRFLPIGSQYVSRLLNIHYGISDDMMSSMKVFSSIDKTIEYFLRQKEGADTIIADFHNYASKGDVASLIDTIQKIADNIGITFFDLYANYLADYIRQNYILKAKSKIAFYRMARLIDNINTFKEDVLYYNIPIEDTLYSLSSIIRDVFTGVIINIQQIFL